jgi:MFS family permease
MTHQEVTASTPRSLLTRPLVLLLIASVGGLAGFYLLMPVVPLYVSMTGMGDVGAGLATGTMMLATVLTELGVPSLVDRYGYRAAMAWGLLLLAVPAAALAMTSSLPVVLGVCLLRGAGLAIIVVAGAALVARLVPDERRGEGLGLYGVAVGVPSIVCLPSGLWLSEHYGYGPVFLVGAALSLLALVAVPGLPTRSTRIEHPGGVLDVLRVGGLARPSVVFGAVTLAAGVLLTFLPLAVGGSRQLAAVALLVQSCATPLARWLAGRYGDRHGSGVLLVPAVLTAALGTAGLVWVHSPLAVIGGAGLFGIGFGIAQNATLALMFERVPKAKYGQASALWNFAFDGGMGIGAIGFGFLAGPAGYPAGFTVTAAVLALAVLPAWRDRRFRPAR